METGSNTPNMGIGEKILEKVILLYVSLIYKPLNNLFYPFFNAHPLYPWITPNRVTIGRTFLCIPTVLALLYNHPFIAFFLVLLNDFFDLIDGIVYRVHSSLNIHYNERFGAFIDGACDKIFNVFVWFFWLLIQITQSGFRAPHLIVIVVIFIEIVFFWKSIQLYYSPVSDLEVKALYAGKAKQTFETFGTAFLFIIPILGYCLLFFSIFLAYKSYVDKIRQLSEWVKNNSH
jgi:phosphatidylglycerophosphate synthase